MAARKSAKVVQLPVSGAQVLKRYERLKSAQLIYRPLHQELAEFIQPYKATINIDRAPGGKMTERLFDATAIHANELLAASLHGALTPSASRWFSMQMRDDALNETQSIREWLEAVASAIYAALNQSNFPQEIDENYLDLGCFGTAATFVEEKDPKPDGGFGGLRFTTIPFGKFWIDENADGRVDVLFREFKMSARAIAGKWEKTCGASVKADAENSPERLLTIIHAVYPAKWTVPGTSKQRAYTSVYVLHQGALVLEEGGFEQFPFMVDRWRKASGEVYGRGPGHTARPDIRTLNKAVEMDLRAWAKNLDPPMASFQDGVIGTVKLYPGANNVLKGGPGATRVQDVIAPIQQGIDYKTNGLKIAELQQKIKQAFFSDQLEPLGAIESRPDMTATEATIRNELMLRLLGPTAGRLEAELLSPMIDRVFNLMFNAKRDAGNPASAGAFPDMPQELLAALGGQAHDLDIKYEGMLARAQQQGDATAIQRALQFIQAIAPIKPEVLDLPNFDEMTKRLFEILGVNADLLNDEQVVAQLREARAQAQQQAQAAQTAGGIAQAAGNAAPMVDSIGKIAASPQAMTAMGFNGAQQAA